MQRLRGFQRKADAEQWLAKIKGATEQSLVFEPLAHNSLAKVYRLLSRVMAVAVEDGVIGKSPCIIKGAGADRVTEMRHATVEQVWELAATVPKQYRALVLTAAWAGLRWGELAGLRRRRVDLLHRTIAVAEKLDEVSGHLEVGPPKTDAGLRTVKIPAFLAAELETHLAEYAQPGRDGLVFPSPEGTQMRRSNFRRRVWLPAVRRLDLVGVRFHDLRHSAGTHAAVAGATTKELMARLGHASPQAALRYKHATAERDAVIADALDRMATAPRPSEAGAVVLPVAPAHDAAGNLAAYPRPAGDEEDDGNAAVGL